MYKKYCKTLYKNFVLKKPFLVNSGQNSVLSYTYKGSPRCAYTRTWSQASLGHNSEDNSHDLQEEKTGEYGHESGITGSIDSVQFDFFDKFLEASQDNEVINNGRLCNTVDNGNLVKSKDFYDQYNHFNGD